MGRATWFMQATAHHMTIWIGARYGDRFPMHFVVGYPRSGTTWFSELLADYLNLPRPRHYIFPIGFAAVIHTHTEPQRKLADCFYVVRDGRDSLVSAYFQLIRILGENASFVYRDRYLKLFGANYDPSDTARNLLLYMRSVFEQNKRHWGEHVVGWMQKAQRYPKQIVVVKYEDLRTNPYPTFTGVLEQKYGSVDADVASDALQRQDFNRQRKRPQGQQRTFMRKGVAGDWRNHFTLECAQLFDTYAGQALIEAGYEPDRSWVSSLAGGSHDSGH